MHIIVVGLNHRSAPLELRERLAFPQEQLSTICTRLREEVGLDEVTILSTCNRVEIYGGVLCLDGVVERLHQFFSAYGQLERSCFVDRLYAYTEPRSVRHLFSVASGLDSMVLGESEITHQVKHAYEAARSCGMTGKVFNGLFQRALNAAKTVRTETVIGSGSMSVGTVAVEVAEKIFGAIGQKTVLLLGAGKIGELTLRRLAERGIQHVRILNRSLPRAEELATAHGAVAFPLTQLAEQLREVDIIISSTSAPTYVVSREEILSVMPQRQHRPLCLIDLGVPRNIDPRIGTLENVYLFNIDDLQGVVEQAHRVRVAAVTQCHEILDRKVEQFIAWWQREGGVRSAPSSSELVGVR